MYIRSRALIERISQVLPRFLHVAQSIEDAAASFAQFHDGIVEHANIAPPTTCAVDRIIRLHPLGPNGEQVACPRVESGEVSRTWDCGEWHTNAEAIARIGLWRDVQSPYTFIVDRASLTEEGERFRDGGTRGLGPFERSDLNVPG